MIEINPGQDRYSNGELKIVFLVWDKIHRCVGAFNRTWTTGLPDLAARYHRDALSSINYKKAFEMRGAIVGKWYDSALGNNSRDPDNWLHEIENGNMIDGHLWDERTKLFIITGAPSKDRSPLDMDGVILDLELEWEKPKKKDGLRPEVLLNPKDFEKVDYMAAVRASCKGMK